MTNLSAQNILKQSKMPPKINWRKKAGVSSASGNRLLKFETALVRLTKTFIDRVIQKTQSRNKVLMFTSKLKHAKEILGYSGHPKVNPYQQGAHLRAACSLCFAVWRHY